jgi:hypothetical protein
MEDLLLPIDLKQLNEHSKSLVKDFPKVDQVAENCLRKYKVRNGGGVGLTNSNNVMSAGSMEYSPSK